MNPSNDFMQDYRALAQQSWDTWMRQWSQPGAAASPFGGWPSPPSDPLAARSAAGLKGFFDWMQSAMTQSVTAQSVASAPDWQQQLQQFFGNAMQPFQQAFAGIEQPGAQGFMQQWQQWQQAAGQGLGGWQAPAAMAPLGYTREQQLEQQAFAAAMQEYLETLARYQTLIQRANAQGVERMQQRLAARGERDQPIDSLKALYEQWVDASEEAYAEIALSDEFRDAYGAMVNAQMRVRQLQQQGTEKLCRELGMPTRSEVASLGQRLQELRRELAELKTRPAVRSAVDTPKANAPAGKRAASKKTSKKTTRAGTVKRAATSKTSGKKSARPAARKSASPRKRK